MRKNSFIFTGKSGKAANTDSLNDQHENQEEGGVCSGEAAAASGTAEMPSDSDNGCSSADAGPTRGRDTYDEASEFKAVLSEIQELWENQGKLNESFKNLRATYHQRNTEILEALQEEQFRDELLEEQLNSFTDQYENEYLNLKEHLSCTQDSIDSSSDTDFYEVLEAFQTRLLKMELRQEQMVHKEMYENTATQNIFVKLINVLLAFILILLVFVSRFAHMVILFKPLGRLLSTLIFASLFFCIWKHWDVVLEHYNYALHTLRDS